MLVLPHLQSFLLREQGRQGMRSAVMKPTQTQPQKPPTARLTPTTHRATARGVCCRRRRRFHIFTIIFHKFDCGGE
ncbi:hypothetical protein DMENIID0001_121180 [Sergentomyia squamirostris]